MRFGDGTVEYAFSEGMITHGASFLGFVSFLFFWGGPSVVSSMRSPVEDHKPRSLSMKPFLLAIRRRETLCSHEPVKYWMAGPQLVVSMNRKSIWIEDECRSSGDTVLPESTDRSDGPPLISPMAS